MTFKVPTTEAEAKAAEQAVAQFRLSQIDHAITVLDSKTVKSFEKMIADLVEGGLPPMTSLQGNLSQLSTWLTNVRAGAQADRQIMARTANPDLAKDEPDAPDVTSVVDPAA